MSYPTILGLALLIMTKRVARSLFSATLSTRRAGAQHSSIMTLDCTAKAYSMACISMQFFCPHLGFHQAVVVSQR